MIDDALFPSEPPLILGLMRLLDYPELARPKALATWIQARLAEGLTTFDHADIYGDGACETAFGTALRSVPGLSQQVRLITKAGIVPAPADGSVWRCKHYRATAAHLTRAIDHSLRRLAVERIDAFLIHRPDPLMEATDVAYALENAVAAGKIRQIGVSNFLPAQWRWLKQNTSLPISCNQSELSLRHSSPLFDGTLEAHLHDGVRWLAWSPLAGGQLTRGSLGAFMDRVTEETGLSATAQAIAWLRQLPGSPVPVIGSLNPDRIQQALTGSQASLPRPLWFALLEAARGHPVA